MLWPELIDVALPKRLTWALEGLVALAIKVDDTHGDVERIFANVCRIGTGSGSSD